MDVFKGTVEAVLTVLAAFTRTSVCASDTTLVALTVFFEAARLATVATLRVETTILNLRLKGMRIPVLDRIHSHLPLIIAFMV